MLILIKAASLILAMSVNFYLLIYLSKDLFGFYAVIFSFLSLNLVVGMLGSSFYLVNFIPKLGFSNQVVFIKKTLIRVLMFSTLSGFLLFVFYSLTRVSELSEQLSFSFFTLFLASSVFYCLNLTCSSSLRSLGYYKLGVVTENIVFNLLLIFIVFSYSPEKYIDLILVITICFMASLVLAFSLLIYALVMKRLSIKDNIYHTGELVVFKNFSVTPYVVLSLVEAITTNLDVIIIGIFFSSQETAEYFFAKKVVVALSLLWIIYNYYYIPVLSKVMVDPKVNSDIIMKIICKRYYILVPFLVVSFIFGTQFNLYSNYFNISDYQISSAFWYFILFYFIHIFTGPVSSVLNITGLVKSIPFIVGLGAAVFLILALPLTFYLGVNGIVISMIISLITWKSIGAIYIYKRLGLNILNGKYV